MKTFIQVLAAVCCLAGDTAVAIVPDLPGTNRSCANAKRFLPSVSCEPDGSYSARQCQLTCLCVNTETGEVNPQYPPFPPTSSVDCVQTFPESGRCPRLECDNMCQFGRMVGRDGCRTCSCILGAGGEELGQGETECDKIACRSIFELVQGGCSHRCVMLGNDGCPSCNRTCAGAEPQDECTVTGDCEADQICISRGLFGQRSCVDRLDEGEECGASQIATLAGTSFGAIPRGSLSQLERANIPCIDGLVCTRVNLTRMECIPVRQAGPCVGGAPDCENAAGCAVEIEGQTFKARHGSVILIPTNCSRCICMNGEARFCRETGLNCSSLLPSARQSCMVEGMEDVEHGDTFMVDCNLCRCRNGRVSCTHARCEEQDEKDTRCMRCRFMPRNPVCGPDGRTYPSECYATECVGLQPVQLLPGPCSRHDVCDRYPCEEGQKCVRTGGVSCFSLEGCQPSDARMCLNPSNLICEVGVGDNSTCDIGEMPEQEEEEEEEEESGQYICSTNGRSYRSICRMLQDTAFTAQVAHIGRCNARMCRGGPICGTDGVTYENLCLLSTQSGSGRVDYNGSCEAVPGATVEAACSNIREKSRCQFNTQNCRSLVRPEEGCCPVCGGSVIAAIDDTGLRDYIRLNPSQQGTLDALLEQLVPYLNIPDRCELQGTLTSTGNLEMILMSSDEDSAFCNNETERIAEQLNDGGGSREARPPLLQYVSAAVTAPLVEETDEGEENGNGGGIPLVASNVLLLLIIVFLGLIN